MFISKVTCLPNEVNNWKSQKMFGDMEQIWHTAMTPKTLTLNQGS